MLDILLQTNASRAFCYPRAPPAVGASGGFSCGCCCDLFLEVVAASVLRFR